MSAKVQDLVVSGLAGVAVYLGGRTLWQEYIESKRMRQDAGRPWATLEAQEDEILKLREALREEREAHRRCHFGKQGAPNFGVIRADSPEDAARQLQEVMEAALGDEGAPETDEDFTPTPERPTPEEIKARVKKAGRKEPYPGPDSRKNYLGVEE